MRQQLERDGRIEVEAGAARLPGFRPAVTGSRERAANIIAQKLADSGRQGVTPADLAPATATAPGIVDGVAEEILEFFVRQGTAVRVGRDRYYEPAVLDEVSRTTVAEIQRLGEISPADLREALGLSRKFLIPLLEWLDGQGITTRVGDARRLGPKAPS